MTDNRHRGPTPETLERMAAIQELLDAGMSIKEVADATGLSKQRIHQIISRNPDGTRYENRKQVEYQTRTRKREKS